MGKNMTSGARRLSGNAVTLLITALLCGGSAALIYSGAASRQISNMLISMACYIVMAVSLNLVVGLLGELSLGHAGFMSVGLFTGCLLSIQLAQSVPIGVRMPLSMLLGGVAAAVVGLLVGLAAIPLLFYGYKGVVGQGNMIVDILIFQVSVLLSFWVSWSLQKRRRLSGAGWTVLGLLVLLGVWALFLLFTFRAPDLAVFVDPLTGMRGIG